MPKLEINFSRLKFRLELCEIKLFKIYSMSISIKVLLKLIGIAWELSKLWLLNIVIQFKVNCYPKQVITDSREPLVIILCWALLYVFYMMWSVYCMYIILSFICYWHCKCFIFLNKTKCRFGQYWCFRMVYNLIAGNHILRCGKMYLETCIVNTYLDLILTHGH